MFVKEKREKRKQVLKRPSVCKHQIARPYKRWLCVPALAFMPERFGCGWRAANFAFAFAPFVYKQKGVTSVTMIRLRSASH